MFNIATTLAEAVFADESIRQILAFVPIVEPQNKSESFTSIEQPLVISFCRLSGIIIEPVNLN